MTFIYDFKHTVCGYDGEIEGVEYEYHYDVDAGRLNEELTNILFGNFVTAEISEEAENQVREMVSELIDGNENELAKWYYDELKEAFYDEARKECNYD